MRFKPQRLVQLLVDHNKFDLHLVRQNALDVHAHGLPRAQRAVRLGQPGQVGRDLDKHAVFLHAAHDADNRLPGCKAGGVLAPGAQQFAQRQHDAPLRVAVFHRAQQLLAHLHAVGGRGDAGDRKAVDGQQRRDAAADIAERAEALDMGHGAGDDAAVFERVQIFAAAAALRLGAGKPVHGLAVLLAAAGQHKAGRPPHAGQHGNVLDRLLRRVVHTFLKRHIGAPPAQRKPQAAAGVKRQGGALQHLPGLQAAGQFLPGQAVGVAAKTFGTIFQHVRFLSIP